jgi:cytochrome c oxidase assembly factor CtaG
VAGVSPYGWSLDAEVVLFVPLLALGLLLVAASFVTPLEGLALRYLLFAHLLQNVVLAEWAPALVVAGLPAGAAAALVRGRTARTLTHPLVALPLWLASYFLWHLPWCYDAALRRPDWLLHLEHLSYFATGVLVWWPVFQDAPRRLSAGAKAAYLFVAFALASPLGLLLALLPKPIYTVYEHAPRRLWGLSPLDDQELAGVTMAAEQAVVFFAVFVTYVARFLRSESAAGLTFDARV